MYKIIIQNKSEAKQNVIFSDVKIDTWEQAKELLQERGDNNVVYCICEVKEFVQVSGLVAANDKAF